MGKREKPANKFRWEELTEEEEAELANRNNASKSVHDCSDDEANEDFSLKIVEKAMLRRAAKLASANDAVSGDPGASNGLVSASEAEPTDSDTKKVAKKDRARKTKKRKIEEDEAVVVPKEDVEIQEVRGLDETNEPNDVQINDNIVLRKLLRGPRYFDPPDKSWGACFNCGEEGHAAVNCTMARRKKPCFVCGSLEHNARQCDEGQDCFICKKGGHHARNCPEKYGSLSSKICLKCGDSGHEMHSCKNDYPSDDLKEIQCYVCKEFGHLCCIKCFDNTLKELSCFKCGQLGHTGMACIGLRRGETTVSGSSRLCYKCHEGGHIARECITSSSARKGYDSPTLRPHKETKDYLGVYSAPHDPNEFRKKHTQYGERDFTTPRKGKPRGGWFVDDPEDFSPRKGKESWKSPASPSSRSHRISSFTAGARASSSRSSKKSWEISGGTPVSQRSYKSISHGGIITCVLVAVHSQQKNP